MTETIASAALAVHENLNIQKRRIQNGKSSTRLSLVTGTHGDELEGQYLAYTHSLSSRPMHLYPFAMQSSSISPPLGAEIYLHFMSSK